jgi:peroxiredoxin
MLAQSTELVLGGTAPDFSLLGTDGKKYSLDSFNGARCLVIIFTSNKCLYTQAYEPRFTGLQRDYGGEGLRICAISSNDELQVPEDGYRQMQVRARTQKPSYPCLRDETQRIAQAYGATCTPEIFLFDSQRSLRYRGRCDDNWKEPTQVKRRELVRAIELTLQNKPIDFEVKPASGTPIRWKKPAGKG